MAPSAIAIPTPDSSYANSTNSSWSSFEPVAFGGDDQWVYDPVSKRFDLSRGSDDKLVIDADDAVRHHR